MMKNIHYLSCVFMLAQQFCFAQITFQKTYGGIGREIGYSIVQAADSNYIIAGWSDSYGSGDKDILLMKLNQSGDTIWSKYFGGNLDDRASSLSETNDGGYIVCGYTTSFGSGNSDVYIIKTDVFGNLLWSKTIGDSLEEKAYSIKQTNDLGFIIAGLTTSTGFGRSENYLIKLDQNGNILWTRTYGTPDLESSNCVLQTSDGGYALIGTRGTGPYPEDLDVQLIRTDNNGNFLWNRTYGFPGSNGFGRDFGSYIQSTSDGGFILGCFTNSFGSGNGDIYILRTDAFGDTMWTKTYGGASDEFCFEINPTQDSGFIIVGTSNSYGSNGTDAYLIKIDSIGNVSWKKTFGGGNYDYAYSAKKTLDGGYIVCGYTENFGAGQSDVYLIKTDSIGDSGCIQYNAGATVIVPNTQVSNPSMFFSSVGQQTNANTLIQGGIIPKKLCSSIGIDEVFFQLLTEIYPNPTQDKLNINLNVDIIDGTLQIFNIFGKMVSENSKLFGSNIELYLTDIIGGAYLLKLFDNKNAYSGKFIFQPK